MGRADEVGSVTGAVGDPRVTVTTVLYNSEAVLPRYACGLAPLLRAGLVRAVAIDNASPDGSGALLSEILPGATVITAEQNLGFAAGSNRAWPLVTTPYWLLLNPDVEISRSGLEALVRWMDSHPRVGVASPRLRSATGHELPVARPHDSLWRPILELLRLHKLIPEPQRSKWLLSGRRSTPEEISGWVPGAALMVRVAAAERVGLLNESLFLYGEDREWCWRMTRGGWAIGVCPRAEFVHIGGSSALATWDEEERARREVGGHLKVTKELRGRLWTRLFALCVGVVLRLEALDRRRGQATRQENRRRSRLYLRAACGPAEK
jgi:N-acetylglucosaminyl-diphospho-decaprenol L-rhamnosyltransferase